MVDDSAIGEPGPTEPFVSIVFHGERFDGAIIPIEVLPELAAYREAVLAAAKGLYRARRDGRERVPKGYESAIRLVLAGAVEEGSAVAQVHRLRVPDEVKGMRTLPFRDEVDDAVDLIEDWFAALSDTTDLPNTLRISDHQRLARNLEKLGTRLRSGESIETRTSARPTGKRFDIASRKRLAELTGQPAPEVEYENLTAFVTSVSASEAGHTFTLDLGDLGVHSGIPFAPGDHDPLRMEAPGSGPVPVVVSLTGLTSKHHKRLDSVTSVVGLTVVDGDDTSPHHTPPTVNDFSNAILELEELEDDWDGQAAAAPSAESMNWVVDTILDACSSLRLPPPWLYPSVDGGIRCEWEVGTWRGSVVFDDQDQLVRYFSTTTDSSDFSEAAFTPPDASASTLTEFFKAWSDGADD